jgi:ribosomal protein S27E
VFYWMEQTPLRESPPPPFIDTRRDGVYAQGIVKVVIISPNRWDAVVEHCGKYTVGYGAWRGSRPGHRPWHCGDCAGILVAPAGGVVVAVGGTVLQAWHGDVPRVLQAKFLFWSKPEPLPRVVPMPFEGSAEGKVEGGMGSWQHSGWSSAEHVLHCIACSHSIATVSGMAEQ